MDLRDCVDIDSPVSRNNSGVRTPRFLPRSNSTANFTSVELPPGMLEVKHETKMVSFIYSSFGLQEQKIWSLILMNPFSINNMFILTALSLRVETVGQSTVNQFFVCVHLG
jgi:hypothetical protein